LELLTAAGLVQRTVRGRQVYFQADREAAIFPELRELFAKTAGLADILREALAPLGPRIVVAFVFGSAARGDLRATSDIDLLVIGDASFDDVVGALAAAQERLGREINPTVYPPAEFRLKARHHFLTSVLQEPKIFVAGGTHELGGLGAQQLADQAPNHSKRSPRSPAGRRPSRRAL
jgi:predicted nucleotidyltransferase